MKRLLLAGGGHAHMAVLKSLAESPSDALAVTLVTPYPWLTYTGMLPGHIAGHYTLTDVTIDLGALLSRGHVGLSRTTITSLDLARREALCADGTVVEYDALSLDVGSQPYIGAARGVERHAVMVRPLERLVAGWNDVLHRAREGGISAITMVGGGAAGVELALAMEWHLRQECAGPRPHVRILEHGPRIVPEFPVGARWRLLRRLKRARIGVHPDCTVSEVGAGYVRLASGLEFATDAVFWVGGAAGLPWIADSGLATDERGFARTNDLLQSVSHPEVFAAGDCAVEEGHPRPRAGVFAVRAGPALAHNLRAFLEGTPLRAHLPPRRFLSLVSTGDRHAVGAYGPWSFGGRWAWRWKDRIDRRWMEAYRHPG